MIVRRVAWVFLGLLLATGCVTTVERGYYAPLGAPFSRSVASQDDKRPELIVEVTCQGIYLNTVNGTLTRTAHVQLDITRTSARQLLFPVEGFRLSALHEDVDEPDFGGADAESMTVITMTPDEAWSRQTKLHQTVLVNPWSNRSLDLFFDFEDQDQPLPPILRFRWRAESEGGWCYGDSQFLRIPEDDPRCPAKLPATDKQFGVRNGYYFPGYSKLGKRGLRDSVEARPHYLFHAP